ncbi:hypothetical protein [Dyadobacter helix]|uniref:hypothetical protein n=1 Tax=Dyadobacter helix TaxID=2822344 RepID=UPI001BFC0A31|nr:hypothetical protein [Dyadobacter sp. CECT 9275]
MSTSGVDGHTTQRIIAGYRNLFVPTTPSARIMVPLGSYLAIDANIAISLPVGDGVMGTQRLLSVDGPGSSQEGYSN